MVDQQFHQLGYTESYSEIQRYKYCFLNDKKRVGITDDFGILGTIDEETDEQMDDEVEVDYQLLQQLMKMKNGVMIRWCPWRLGMQTQSLSLLETIWI